MYCNEWDSETKRKVNLFDKKYKVTLFVSNYSKSGHPLTVLSKYEELLHLLEQENINYHFPKSAKWVALGNPATDRNDSQDILMERYDDCRHYCRSIVGNYLFLCAT